ncbi:MAG: hypothetical protein WC745_00350 [Patescibacteria group bacterium]|jgi:hypothetical protein
MRNNHCEICAPTKKAKPAGELPESWIKAAGILKGKKIDALKFQKKIRKEWETRMKKLEVMRKSIISSKNSKKSFFKGSDLIKDALK